MDELTERQKIILLLDGAIADLERACRKMEYERYGEAEGFIHSVISRLERNSKELEIMDANEKADAEERANMEAIFVR